MQLDGELNQKPKFAIQLPYEARTDHLGSLQIVLSSKVMNGLHPRKEAGVTFLSVVNGDDSRAEKFPYDKVNTLYAGTKLSSGQNVVAVVVATGRDCEIRTQASSTKPFTPLQTTIDAVCMANLLPLMLYSSIMALIMHANFDDVPPLFSLFVQSILFLNTIIPLSLQFYFNDAAEVVADRIARKHKVEISSKGTLAIQCRPDFIVTDKTGTLTTNQTVFLSSSSTSSSYSSSTSLDQTKSGVLGPLACNGTRVLPDGKLLNVDAIDYNLLLSTNVKLLANVIRGNHSSGYIEWLEGQKKYTLKRVYFKEFDHITEVKCAIVIGENKGYELHVQGTPEAVEKYSRFPGQIKDLLTCMPTPSSENTQSYRRIIAYGSRTLSEKETKEFLALATLPEERYHAEGRNTL